jgi:hypothetical protein
MSFLPSASRGDSRSMGAGTHTIIFMFCHNGRALYSWVLLFALLCFFNFASGKRFSLVPVKGEL